MAATSSRQLRQTLLLALLAIAVLPHTLSATEAEGVDLYLEVFVNGTSTDLIGHFRQGADGRFTAEPAELAEVGIRPAAEAEGRDGFIRLDALPGVSFQYDAAAQRMRFETGDSGRAPRVLDAGRLGERETTPSETGTGALMNYSLLASTASGGFRDIWAFDGLSAVLEPRVYGSFGVLDHAMIVSGNAHRGFDETRRLSTTWTLTDTEALRSMRIGDIVTGGLSWTRPVRLGGLQIQSDFALRPDLVTFPVPNVSGTAAVPSTVEVYLDNARRYSADVPAGPFTVSNLPVVEGGSTARLVVRDAQGVERVSEAPFFASSRLLAPGLADYSAALGFARRFYGVKSDDYDRRPMGSASLRYGWSDRLTVETHAEGGEGLANAGLGAVFALGPFGVAGLAAAGSRSEAGTGALLAGELRTEWGGFVLNARSQRTLGSYDDIASVTAEDDRAVGLASGVLVSRRPPRETDQVALSFPLPFDPSTLSLSLARLVTERRETTAIAGVSYARSLPGNASLFASGFLSLDGGEAGLFAGISFTFGNRVNAQVSGFAADASTGGTVDVSRNAGRAVGDSGWRLRGGAGTTSGGSVTYNAAPARLEAAIEGFEGAYRGSVRAEGAVAVAGGRPRLTRRIDDAFALVDVGAPGVEVLHENRPIGRSGADGRILVPDLRSNERNDISFDPAALPLDLAVPATRHSVRPARRAGVAVDFGIEPQARAALVSFRRADGTFVPAGSSARMAGGAEEVLVGYDGEAYLSGVEAENDVVVEDAERGTCLARFPFARNAEQTRVADVLCVAVGEMPR